MPSIDNYVSAAIRQQIEERYYSRINEQARLENLIHDPTFAELDGRHVALFADHGVIHVRDVIQQVLATLDTMHGILIPSRPAERLAWMREYGVLLALLHDIGMVDFSIFGREMHPETAAQAVFSAELEDIVELIWQDSGKSFAERLRELAEQDDCLQSPKLLMRELLALSMGHSKRKVPIEILNDPGRFRQVMIEAISADLQVLFLRQQSASYQPAEIDPSSGDDQDIVADTGESSGLSSIKPPETNATRFENQVIASYYDDVATSAYQWMISSHPLAFQLLEDATDTIRILRCADALRQRGTVLKTSGSYEVFVDQRSANAVYALRKGDDRLILLELPDAISAGEANIASSQLDQNGDLRISFHRGSFANPGAVDHATYCAALIVQEIKEDVIDSFERSTAFGQADLKSPAEMKILLEETDDNLEFAALVCQHMMRIYPDMVQNINTVPTLEESTEMERELYLSSAPVDWDLDKCSEILAHIASTGHLVTELNLEQAFDQVKLIHLSNGQNLVEAGGAAAFVYIPLGAGLKIIPLGGYEPFMAQPWAPLGITGVIRGAVRNATIVASADLELLMIPKSVYLRHWYKPYSQGEFRHWLHEERLGKTDG